MKKLTTTGLIIVFILAFASFKSLTVKALSGTGASDDPYVISTPADLIAMHDDVAAYYVLANDIDMEAYMWVPIGDASDPFVGGLDGAGFSILNFSSETITVDYGFDELDTMAMFALVADSAEISNLGLEVKYVFDNEYNGNDINVGALVGYVESTDVLIEDIWVSGSITVDTVTSGSVYVGGIIAQAFNQYNLSGLSFTGVIGVAIDEYNSGYFGGLVGYGQDLSILYSKVYDTTFNLNTTYGSEYNGYVGGLIGDLYLIQTYEDDSTLRRNIVDNIDVNTNYRNTVGGLVGTIHNDSGDFLFTIDENLVVDSNLGDGNYMTGGLVGYLNSIKLRQNQVESVTMGSDNENDDMGGLVAYAGDSILEDNRIIDLSITSGEDSGAIGGVAGNIERSTIERTFVSGTLNSSSYDVGGIVGGAYELDLAYSAFEGTITGLYNVGGLVGNSSEFLLQIYSCWVKGSVTGTDNSVGGLVGSTALQDLLIQDSYALADVDGLSAVGGLVGTLYETNAVIQRSYFGGIVAGDSNVDALFGLIMGPNPDTEYLYYDEAGGTSAYGLGVPVADLKDAGSVVGLGLEASDQTIDYSRWQEWFV
ncbi:MAG: hypothetical protein WCI62_01105, partial [Erysipelotrichaceae bacterium]